MYKGMRAAITAGPFACMHACACMTVQLVYLGFGAVAAVSAMHMYLDPLINSSSTCGMMRTCTCITWHPPTGWMQAVRLASVYYGSAVLLGFKAGAVHACALP